MEFQHLSLEEQMKIAMNDCKQLQESFVKEKSENEVMEVTRIKIKKVRPLYNILFVENKEIVEDFLLEYDNLKYAKNIKIRIINTIDKLIKMKYKYDIIFYNANMFTSFENIRILNSINCDNVVLISNSNSNISIVNKKCKIIDNITELKNINLNEIIKNINLEIINSVEMI